MATLFCSNSAMFRNKVLVRAAPTAPPPPFLLRQVSFHSAVPALGLDILCCRLSRRHHLACIPQPPSDALVVYQRCQSRVAVEVVSEIAAASTGASVGDEEEVVCPGSLVAKAVECGLRSLMLEHGWRCLGESIYVHSTFAPTEERTDLCALNVEVKLGRNNDLEFIVSPDALCFFTHKMETFKDGKEVILDGCNFETACTTLPTLQEGHVVGFSKILPTGQCLDEFMQLCSVKHGLEANYSYHAAVRLTYGTSREIWLPSSFVLRGLGLQPAPKSYRESKAMSALQSFIRLLNAWNFFGQSQLVIKEQSLLNCTTTLPTWDKAISNARTENSEDLALVHTKFVTKDQSFTLDFRTPKPAVLCSPSVKSWGNKAQERLLSLDNVGTSNEKCSINHGCQMQPIVPTSSDKSQVILWKPSFSRRKSDKEQRRKHYSDHFSANNSNKSSGTALTNSAQSPLQDSGNHKTEHAEFVDRSCQRVILKAHLQDYSQKENLDESRKICILSFLYLFVWENSFLVIYVGIS
ncbi:hypothetical protein GUJ93_ZPchr0010g7498 [Zizania palustris]|uniref:Uncharacterized protein n=1 Tax=Zizania palustris TaxID=103762 RepID=A0A8J5WCG0_ZIZPA|nr:hypothetical protein GUJ93_ZPchr0010g7498 [Zizania palustris]